MVILSFAIVFYFYWPPPSPLQRRGSKSCRLLLSFFYCWKFLEPHEGKNSFSGWRWCPTRAKIASANAVTSIFGQKFDQRMPPKEFSVKNDYNGYARRNFSVKKWSSTCRWGSTRATIISKSIECIRWIFFAPFIKSMSTNIIGFFIKKLLYSIFLLKIITSEINWRLRWGFFWSLKPRAPFCFLHWRKSATCAQNGGSLRLLKIPLLN